jgi:oligopeptide transport system permease protein
VILDLPESFHFKGRGVDEIIASGFPVSAAVGLTALMIALGLGVPLGAYAAMRPNTLEDRATVLAATLGICTPSMILGPVIAMLLGLKLRWFNASGWYEASDVVMPALTLGLIYSAQIARLTRGSLRETLALEFVRTARAKGASEASVVFLHALKLACLPVLNFLGPAAAGLLTGSIIVEAVFQLPGLGQFFIASAINRDMNLAIAISVFYASLIVLFNLLVDLVQAWLNPRIRLHA